MKHFVTFFLAFTVFFYTSNAQNEKEYKFLIKTNYGNITVKLYNDTPKHRDNFVKLVNEGFYNGSIFHRVINQFMIQGGGAKDGTEDVGYTIPAEIVPKYFHKKGALAAARMPDYVNPNKESSGSQFYIVQGRTFTDAELNSYEQRLNKKFTEQEREAYKTIGGAPHLDGAYTIFGEVIDGLDVVDKIASVKTKAGDRPVEDVIMTIVPTE